MSNDLWQPYICMTFICNALYLFSIHPSAGARWRGWPQKQSEATCCGGQTSETLGRLHWSWNQHGTVCFIALLEPKRYLPVWYLSYKEQLKVFHSKWENKRQSTTHEHRCTHAYVHKLTLTRRLTLGRRGCRGRCLAEVGKPEVFLCMMTTVSCSVFSFVPGSFNSRLQGPERGVDTTAEGSDCQVRSEMF